MAILLVEDDNDYAEIAAHTLRRSGYDVVIANDVSSAMQFATRKPPTAAILDVVLPDGTGLDVCRMLRELQPGLPILFLSSLDSKSDVVAGFDSGADDYLTKPFSPSELLARVAAVLRRAGAARSIEAQADQRLVNGGLLVDRSSQSASWNGKELNLTTLEVDILWQLVRYPGQALSHAFLTEEIWGYNNVRDATLLKGHVSSIRKKLRDAGAPDELIRTVHGVGYSFTPV
jgi:DNA-binding response OmpR family regulator